MRRIGIFFFALFAITVVLAGCGEKEPKKTEDQEATPSVSLLPQDAPVFSSDELFFPNVGQASVTTTTTAKPSSTTAATSSATGKTTSSAGINKTETTTTVKAPSDKGGLELPDHNWN